MQQLVEQVYTQVVQIWCIINMIPTIQHFLYVYSNRDGGAEHYPFILRGLFFNMRLSQKEKKKTCSALVKKYV